LIVPPPGFLKALQERCRRHGIMIVLDEVKVGLGRSGLMHCFQHEGLTPDMVVFGKGLGGGLPLSAVVGPKAIMDHAPAFALLTTAGNPVATAAGNAVLETIENEGLIERARRVGKLFSDALRALGAKHEIIGDVRGRGLAVGIELVGDRTTREPVSAMTTAKIIYRGYEIGAAFTYVGLRANVLEFMPPLTLTEDEAVEGASIVDQAITDVLAGKVADKDVASFMMW
jgi:4-aminobutyrate aminotransferase